MLSLQPRRLLLDNNITKDIIQNRTLPCSSQSASLAVIYLSLSPSSSFCTSFFHVWFPFPIARAVNMCVSLFVCVSACAHAQDSIMQVCVDLHAVQWPTSRLKVSDPLWSSTHYMNNFLKKKWNLIYFGCCVYYHICFIWLLFIPNHLIRKWKWTNISVNRSALSEDMS